MKINFLLIYAALNMGLGLASLTVSKNEYHKNLALKTIKNGAGMILTRNNLSPLPGLFFLSVANDINFIFQLSPNSDPMHQ